MIGACLHALLWTQTPGGAAGGRSYASVVVKLVPGARKVASLPLQRTAHTLIGLVTGATAVQAAKPYDNEMAQQLQLAGFKQITPQRAEGGHTHTRAPEAQVRGQAHCSADRGRHRPDA